MLLSRSSTLVDHPLALYINRYLLHVSDKTWHLREGVASFVTPYFAPSGRCFLHVGSARLSAADEAVRALVKRLLAA